MGWRKVGVTGIAVVAGVTLLASAASAVAVRDVKPGEDVFQYVERMKGGFDQTFYQQVVGAATSFKEGDEAIGVAADDDASRENARRLLANTKIQDIHETVLFEDGVQKLIWSTIDLAQYEKVKGWTLGELKTFILTRSEDDVKSIMYGLNSDVIANVVKLMSNDELITVGQKVFNPLPGSKIGARGYMGARIQPNSPTDNTDDIVWQVFDGWAYAVGDVVLGTNPVDSVTSNVANVEAALKDVVMTFGLADIIPWCVLAHIDVQAEVEKKDPGATALWFQSLAGTESANKTFDLTIQGMLDYAKQRTGKYGLYFETGQGADFTNGHAHGFDMVVHESRKYGFARALQLQVAAAQLGRGAGAWVHLNDVAGFIGPEVFKTREQLVRCCLEDIAMGKLHGLTIGLDICSTLHMPVTLDDLNWCIDQIMPANPGYLMGLPTKNDPMLSYLTTGYQDHVRVREKFGYKVNDKMWEFFQRLQVIDADGKPTEHFGDPIWVYYQYRLAKGDSRSKDEIYAEGKTKVNEIQSRGVPLAIGHGENVWDLNPELDKQIRDLYNDAKVSLWAEWTEDFINSIPSAIHIQTQSKDREDYVAHPSTGEELSEAAVASLEKLRTSWGDKAPDVQIVISDGLNVKAIMDDGHLMPYLNELRKELGAAGLTVAEENVVVTSGRVRAGYRCGEVLFSEAERTSPRAVVHIIGERPGSGHHNFSAYLAAPPADKWRNKGTVDHDIAKVVSGISDTAYDPKVAAKHTVNLLKEMMKI